TIANTNGQENAAAQGDLDITGRGHTTTVNGKGAGISIINGNGIDRVFQVLGGANATFANLTVEGGVAQDDGAAFVLPGFSAKGGGLLVQDGGHVSLSRAWVQGNQAIGGAGSGGTRSRPDGSPGWAAEGGGLFVSSGVVNMSDSQILGNAA